MTAEWKDPRELDSVSDGTDIVILTRRHKIVLAKKVTSNVFGAIVYVGRGYLRNIIAWLPLPSYKDIYTN